MGGKLLRGGAIYTIYPALLSGGSCEIKEHEDFLWVDQANYGVMGFNHLLAFMRLHVIFPPKVCYLTSFLGAQCSMYMWGQRVLSCRISCNCLGQVMLRGFLILLFTFCYLSKNFSFLLIMIMIIIMIIGSHGICKIW